MFGRPKDEPVELECPECGTVFKVASSVAEKGKVRCPRGHEFAVMGMLGGPGGGAGENDSGVP
jgi:predicted Zn finger-like uncharacterized protein